MHTLTRVWPELLTLGVILMSFTVMAVYAG